MSDKYWNKLSNDIPTSSSEKSRHEWIAAQAAGQNSHSSKISWSAMNQGAWALLFGWILGFIAILVLMIESHELNLLDAFITLVCSIAVFVLMQRYIGPVLQKENSNPYSAKWLFCVGVASPLLGWLMAHQLRNPTIQLNNLLLLFGAVPVVIAGPVGAGKGPLMNRLSEYGLPMSQSSHGASPFRELFWTNMRRYAFVHEVREFMESAQEENSILDTKATPFVVMNGSFREDVWCHSRALAIFKKNLFDPGELDTLEGLGLLMERQFPPLPIIFYLSCHPRILGQRIQRYGPDPEHAITMEYLTVLAGFYGDLMNRMPTQTHIEPIHVDHFDFYADTRVLDQTVENIINILRYVGAFEWGNMA